MNLNHAREASTLLGECANSDRVEKSHTITLMSRPANLYYWDSYTSHFTFEQSIHAKIVKRTTKYGFWLIAESDEDNKIIAEHLLISAINARWSNSNMALTWNNSERGGIMTFLCFKFFKRDEFEEFQAAFSQYLYENMTSVGWDKSNVRAHIQFYNFL